MATRPMVAIASRGRLPARTSCQKVLAIIDGGHVRVGFEDNVYLSKGVPAKSNGELVEKVVRMAKEFGREVATPDEARRILGLKK